MKKIFTFAAMLFAAMTMSAQDPIAATCAEAAAAMPAQKDAETEAVYIVTGYITNTNGNISKGQQTFYMDDEKGTKKTLQGYYCNLPAGETNPLNVGDKITLTGKILNYNNTPEIKNGQVAILERATVTIDTVNATVCEALGVGEALNDKDYSADVFRVHGRIKGSVQVNKNGQYSFEMACGDKIFKPYNCNVEEGVELGKKDSVVVIGKLYNYGGVIEISGGQIELLEKNQEEEVIIKVNVADAVAAAMALGQGKTSDDTYAITGYVDSIATAYSEQYGNISFFMTDDMENPTYEFEAYRVKVYDWQAARIVVGAQVTVTAAIQHYYAAATDKKPEVDLAETVAGGTVEFVGFEGINNVRDNEQTIKRIENGQVVIIRNNVKYNALGVEVK